MEVETISRIVLIAGTGRSLFRRHTVVRTAAASACGSFAGRTTSVRSRDRTLSDSILRVGFEVDLRGEGLAEQRHRVHSASRTHVGQRTEPLDDVLIKRCGLWRGVSLCGQRKIDGEDLLYRETLVGVRH